MPYFWGKVKKKSLLWPKSFLERLRNKFWVEKAGIATTLGWVIIININIINIFSSSVVFLKRLTDKGKKLQKNMIFFFFFFLQKMTIFCAFLALTVLLKVFCIIPQTRMVFSLMMISISHELATAIYPANLLYTRVHLSPRFAFGLSSPEKKTNQEIKIKGLPRDFKRLSILWRPKNRKKNVSSNLHSSICLIKFVTR